MATFKPTNFETFGGRKDALKVSAWLYQAEVYLDLLHVRNPHEPLNEDVKISLALYFVKSLAAQLWFIMAQEGQTLAFQDYFLASVRDESISKYAVRRSCDKLRRLVQRTKVSAYLKQVWSLVIFIPVINKAKTFQRFCSALKQKVILKVLTGYHANSTAPSQIAFGVDDALMGASMINEGGFRKIHGAHFENLVSNPIVLENTEAQRPDFESARTAQRRNYIETSACTKLY